MKIGILALVIAASSGLAAESVFAVTCGDTITDKQTLTADLTCATGPALTIAPGGSLDMGGHTLACGARFLGVLMSGDGAVLANGRVSNCGNAVFASGSDQRISAIFADDSYTAFRLLETVSNVQVTDCTASTAQIGIMLFGTGNRATRFSAVDCVDGILTTGSESELSEISVRGSDHAGITLTGTKMKLRKASIANSPIGLYVVGSDNGVDSLRVWGSTDTGVLILDTRQVLQNCSVATGAAGATGISVRATNSSLSKCTTTGGQIGIDVGGNANSISENRAFGSLFGIYLQAFARNNEISRNLAMGSGTVDLEDAGDCSQANEWSRNVGLRTDACIH